MASDKTRRRGIKWARVHGKRGAWTVAQGWRGDVQGVRVNTTPKKHMADIIARHWLEDQPPWALEKYPRG